MESQTGPLVLYHGGGCRDGWTAAWLFQRAYPDAELTPVNYGEPPPPVAGRVVYVVDFCYPAAVLREMVAAAKSLTVIDHHKTAGPQLRALLGISEAASGAAVEFVFHDGPLAVLFDPARSGAMLAWDYLNATWDPLGSRRRGDFWQGNPPWLVRYVQDRDLWKYELPDSREINAALQVTPFDQWDAVYTQLQNPGGRDDFARRGAAILAGNAETVARHVGNAAPVEIAGYRVPAVNATTLISEIGQELARGQLFAATWFERADGTRVWSLRSEDGGADVSEIAKRFGGGGHKHAAGFEVKLPASGDFLPLVLMDRDLGPHTGEWGPGRKVL